MSKRIILQIQETAMAKILESQAAWNVWGTACGLACLEWSDQRECNSYSLSNPPSTPVKYTCKIHSTSVRFSLLLVRSLNSNYCSLSFGPGLHLHSQHPPSIQPAYKSRSGLREKLFVNWIIFHHLFLPMRTGQLCNMDFQCLPLEQTQCISLSCWWWAWSGPLLSPMGC